MSGGLGCISKSGDVFPLEDCEIIDEWEGSPPDPIASEALRIVSSVREPY